MSDGVTVRGSSELRSEGIKADLRRNINRNSVGWPNLRYVSRTDDAFGLSW